MRKQWLPLVTVFLLVLGVFVVYTGSAEKESFDLPSDFGSGPEVLSCRYGESCVVKNITERPTECSPYHPRGGKVAECNHTSENVDSVSLVTDSANYVEGRFSNKRFAVDYISHENSGPYRIIDYTDLEFFEDGSYLLVTSNQFLSRYSPDHERLSYTHLEKYIDNEELIPNSSVLIQGFAIDPEYEENHHIYVYYYVKKNGIGFRWSNQKNPEYYDLRVSRFSFDPGKEKTISEEKLLLDIDGGRAHAGGEVEIGPDKKLYITVGDGTTGSKAQNLSNYRGKILRLNRNGSVPEDNPFEDSFIYSYGHRNPQSLAWDPETGDLYSSEHGQERYDEINHIAPGINYGWPIYSCDRKRVSGSLDQYRSPLRCYTEWSLAPSSGVFVDEESSPWHGSLFMTGLRGNHVRGFEVSDRDLKDEEILFYSMNPAENNLSRRFRDIEFFGNSLYVVGDGEGIARLEPIY